jgi:hypothetical protein
VNYTTSVGLEKHGWRSQKVHIGHNFMKVAFSLQQKLALEEGSIRHYEFNNGAAILVASITHLLCRQDSSFLRPKKIPHSHRGRPQMRYVMVHLVECFV